jgi:hypothetical protein
MINGQPAANLEPGAGDPYNDNVLSLLPGQKLSSCTCPGAGTAHPGPILPSGAYVGRGAPELDIMEGRSNTTAGGRIVQSAQFGPFDWGYEYPNGSIILADESAEIYPGKGGAYQQTVAVATAASA